MYISARERKILEFLLNAKEETTVMDLANELTVSPRTIHRDLKGVEETLKEYNLVLDKKASFGIQVYGNNEEKEKLKLLLFNLFYNEYTPKERQTIICSELLDTSEPLKLVALANDLNVTIATISNDLNKVEERLAPFDLTVVRKRGYGVEITGSETAKRRAMSKIIIDNIDEFEFISIIKETIQRKSSQIIDTVTDRLLGLVEKKKLLIIEKQIDQVKGDLPYSFSDGAYIGLVVHLALAIERIQQGEDINFDENYLESLKETKEFKVAKKIVSGLEEVFHIDISLGEVGYITMHLMGAKIRHNQDDLLEETSLQIGVLAQNLIRFVSKEISRDMTKNITLFQGLVAHLRPAMYRIKQEMGITNPLLSQIEQDYHEMFSILENGVKNVFPDLNVPKEEIGYLVMHFASALLHKEEGEELKVLIVCSSGIGTSKMLSTKLEQEIPGIKTENASLFDLDKINVKEFNAIISTIVLTNMNEEYLIVSPLLSKDDLAKIKLILHGQTQSTSEKRWMRKKDTIKANSGEFLQDITRVKNYSTGIHQILSGFKITDIKGPVLIESALRQLCEPMNRGNIINQVDGVIENLLKRETLGGLGIPNTSLALYHTKSDEVQVPSFTIGRLLYPVTLKAMDNTMLEVNTILLMLTPQNSSDETLELLSGISSLIIRDEESIITFQSGSFEDVMNLLSSELKLLYETKTTI